MTKIFRGFRLMTMQPDGEPYGLMDDAAMIVSDGAIRWLGSADDMPVIDDPVIVEGDGRFLSPGLIDCHTHLVYGGNRADEWEKRLNGVPYEEIAKQGGGILSTVQATRAASEDELVASAKKRLLPLTRQGVTAVEIKSGYGLDIDTELKMLRAARRLEQELPVHVSPTLLAAHAVPPEFTNRADEYIDLVCHEIIPAAAEHCDAVDVFCESIAFNLNQTRRVFAAARATDARLQIKVHAEQLSYMGAALMAAQMGAMSVDHIEYLRESECPVLADSGTVATLLPGAFYNLRETQKPPVSALRAAGVPMAIATDANPGSSPVNSILLMAHMACTLFGLTPEEAIVGLTRHAAQAMGCRPVMGTLEPDKLANFAVWDIQTPAELAYGIGHNPCVAVYHEGEVIFDTENADV